jgi:nitrite reductase (NADH) small subunit
LGRATLQERWVKIAALGLSLTPDMGHEVHTWDTGIRPEDLDTQRPRPLDTPWGSFALYSVDGRILAGESWCPHMQKPLFQGSLRGAELTCPWHSWVFSLETGECTWAPEGAGEIDARIRRCAVSLGPEGTYRLHPPD